MTKFNGSLDGLVNVGNLSGNVPQRKIRALGHHYTFTPSNRFTNQSPELILKTYAMEEKDKRAPSVRDMVSVHELLNDEFKNINIEILSGMGFLILSNGILNVCRWDTEYPDVVVPMVYEFNGKIWAPQSIEKVGAFCSGEKRVYDHENGAWLEYLYSARTDKDKLIYVNDFLEE
jgi:hypothetical protein